MARRAGRPVRRFSAFWDTSALVPLCVRHVNTPRAIAAYKNYDAIVWWATPVEIASALARLVRMKQLNLRDWTRAHELAASLADAWSVIQPSTAVRTAAVQLVDRYDLRGADALQLAAALEWCEGMPQERIFLTADHKLQDAARHSGFDARQI